MCALRHVAPTVPGTPATVHSPEHFGCFAVAVVDVEALPSGAQPLSLSDSDALLVGQTVAAIGSTFGLEGTLTVGIVSAVGRARRIGDTGDRAGQ